MTIGRIVAAIASGLGMLLAVGPAVAADGTISAADTAWMLTATALVLFMTLPGLGLFYGGLVRAGNMLSVLMHCFAIACAASMIWLMFGYSLVFSGEGAWLGDFARAFLSGVSATTARDGLPEVVFFAYQMTFAIITPALIVGAYPERVRFPAVLLFSTLWLIVVYLPVAHWVWGGGWLARLGVMDFAGGIVVHATAGVSSLVFALLLGKRRGFPQEIRPPHSAALVMAGAGMLWVGWFGFNGGSALGATGGAGFAIVNTHVAACAAALTWMAGEWARFGRPSAVGFVTGAVAGLATVTPAAGFIGPAGALALGALAGIGCQYMVTLIRVRLKIDDSLDVFAVHGAGGIAGSILTAVFALPALGGAGYAIEGTFLHQLFLQMLGVGVVSIFSAVATIVLYKGVNALTAVRADAEAEFDGLDIAEHGERAYDLL